MMRSSRVGAYELPDCEPDPRNDLPISIKATLSRALDLVLSPGWRNIRHMIDLLAELRARSLRYADGPQCDTTVPRVVIGTHRGETQPVHSLYEPMHCLVLQGAKRVTIGDQTLRYDASNYFVASLDLPATSYVVEAGSDEPYIMLGLRIDPKTVASLLLSTPADKEPEGLAFGLSPVTTELLEVWLRLVRLFDTPEDTPALAPLAERELLYRLLRGPRGGLLRQFAREDSRLSRVRRAIQEIRQSFDRPLRVEELAGLAGMSTASFHRHFKAATAMSPLQYQKMVRLHRARNLLLARETAGSVAHAVGYESASQFSREYARLFGAPPIRDAAQFRTSGGPPG